MCYSTVSKLKFCDAKLQAFDDVMLSNVCYDVAFGTRR